MLRIVEQRDDAKGEVRSALDELAREGARRMLAEALDVEVEAYIERHRRERDDQGRALVVRNGHARERRVTVGSGALTVWEPRVNDQRVVDGERQKFTSEILPPYLRRSKAVSEVLPVLYPRGLSTGDFREGLAALLGENAAGLSPSAITRLVSAWQEEYRAWRGHSPTASTCTSGPTGCTSTCAWRTSGWPRWWSSVPAPTGRRRWWRSRTATASRRRAGCRCCAT